MMRNDSHKKALVLGIIVLFICMSNMSIAGNLKMEKQTFQELLPMAHSTDNVSGISLITLKINGEKGLNDWYVQDIGVNITHESDDIAAIYFRIDGDQKLYTKPFYIKDDGTDIVLDWRAVDYGGNYSDSDSFICSMDKTPPVIDLTYEWEGTEPPYLFIFTANATDATSGMERVEFYQNGELQKTVYGPGPEYFWEFLFWPVPYPIWKAIAYDMAGNTAFDTIKDPVNSKVLQSSMFISGIDKVSSVKSCSNHLVSNEIFKKENNKATEMSPSDYSKTGVFNPAYIIVVFNRKMGNNGWIVSNISISILYESGRIDKVYYQLNFGSWNLYNDPLVISEDGIYVFSWYVFDSEGYTSTTETISLKIDRTPPEINLIRKRLEIDKVKIIANVYDETSNIDRVEFSDSPYNVDFTDYDFPYEWIWTGFFNEKLIVRVYDKAGNSNTSSINTWKCNSYFSANSLVLKLLERFPLLREVFARFINI